MADKNLCWETGQPLPEGIKDTAHFSSDKARVDWGNRRKNRGAIIYDLLMAWRYDRSLAKALGVFTTICALLKEWHDEDQEAGRTSATPVTEVMNRVAQRQAGR